MNLQDVEVFLNPAYYKRMDGTYWICGCRPEVPYSEQSIEYLRQKWRTERDTLLSRLGAIRPEGKCETVTVTSNSDASKSYSVKVYENGKVECECKGFQFRKTCSHADKVKEERKIN